MYGGVILMKTIPNLAKPPTGQSHIQAFRDDLISYLEYAATQGDLVRVPIPLTKFYIANHPALVEEVLLKQSRSFQKPENLKYVAKQFFGENVFTSDGEVWTTLRSAIRPAFNRDRLSEYAQLMIQQTEKVMESWEENQVIEMSESMMDLTLRTTTLCFFGVNLSNTERGKELLEFIQLFFQRIQVPPFPKWLPVNSNRRLKYLVRSQQDFCSRLIEERRLNEQQTNDVLSLLLTSQENDSSGILSDTQICNEVFNLFAAGYEVTAYTLAFSLYLLALNPQKLEKMRSDVQNIEITSLCNPDRTFSYLDQVIKESMRLFPVAAVVSRQSITSLQLQDYILPRKSVLLIPPWTLHRRPEIYDDPLTFTPERFDGDRTYPKFAYLPFSGGPRACIGQAFAMMQMKINLVMILKKFRPTLLPDYEFKPVFQFNTRPLNGMPMKLESWDD